MRSRLTLIIAAVIAVIIIAVGAVLLSRTALNPAAQPQFQAAVDFARAIGTGDNLSAQRLLTPEMRVWVLERCTNGQIATCLDAFIPSDWGTFDNVIYRDSTPDNGSWDVELSATYTEGVGASGICIYVRVEHMPEGDWRVSHWAGWISCNDPRSRDMAHNPETPNRAP